MFLLLAETQGHCLNRPHCPGHIGMLCKETSSQHEYEAAITSGFMVINAKPDYINPIYPTVSCFQLDKAIALSVLSLPKRDDVPIIQAPHRRRNYQI